MTKYEKRLVEIAKEVIELDKAETLMVTSQEEADKIIHTRELMYYSRVNYLLGYILALDELTAESQEEYGKDN